MLRMTLFGRFALSGDGGRDIPLTARRARALLAYLAVSPGHSRSREEIMALLWSERAERQARGSLRQVLSGLRRELGPQADAILSDNERVALVPGRFEIAPREGAAEFLSGLHINDPAFDDWLRDERARHDTPPSGADPRPRGEKPDIAVLPFEAMSDDSGTDGFSDGLTEDLITELSRFQAFTVYSPWSSFAYDASRTTEEIAQDLEIDYVLEGSVRRSGDRVRITAMLFDVETVNHVWVQRYDRDLHDIFAVQEEVARAITVDVSGRIEADAHDEAMRRRPTERSAYDHVLMGERAQHEDWFSSEAVAHYRRAIAADPDCARAIANLANWHACRWLGGEVSFDAAHAEARAMGETALTLAPTDAIVLAIMADAYVSLGEAVLARQCIDKAIRRNPNHHSVMIFAASTLCWLGEVDQAQDWLSRYLRHDTLWTAATMEVCLTVYYAAHRFDEAVASVARRSDLPSDMVAALAAAQAQCGRMDEARALCAQYHAQLPEGQSFEARILTPLGLCPDAAQVALWTEGYRKAGFAA